jgi:hypothetical protein
MHIAEKIRIIAGRFLKIDDDIMKDAGKYLIWGLFLSVASIMWIYSIFKSVNFRNGNIPVAQLILALVLSLAGLIILFILLRAKFRGDFRLILIILSLFHLGLILQFRLQEIPTNPSTREKNRIALEIKSNYQFPGEDRTALLQKPTPIALTSISLLPSVLSFLGMLAIFIFLIRVPPDSDLSAWLKPSRMWIWSLFTLMLLFTVIIARQNQISEVYKILLHCLKLPVLVMCVPMMTYLKAKTAAKYDTPSWDKFSRKKYRGHLVSFFGQWLDNYKTYLAATFGDRNNLLQYPPAIEVWLVFLLINGLPAIMFFIIQDVAYLLLFALLIVYLIFESRINRWFLILSPILITVWLAFSTVLAEHISFDNFQQTWTKWQQFRTTHVANPGPVRNQSVWQGIDRLASAANSGSLGYGLETIIFPHENFNKTKSVFTNIINLLGIVGGVTVLVLYSLFLTGARDLSDKIQSTNSSPQNKNSLLAMRLLVLGCGFILSGEALLHVLSATLVIPESAAIFPFLDHDPAGFWVSTLMATMTLLISAKYTAAIKEQIEQ